MRGRPSSGHEGFVALRWSESKRNLLTENEQWAKLRLVRDVARKDLAA